MYGEESVSKEAESPFLNAGWPARVRAVDSQRVMASLIVSLVISAGAGWMGRLKG